MLTASQLELCKKQHKEFHRDFVWRSDEKNYGKPELWEGFKNLNGRLAGDCDDWAIEMDRACAKLGVSTQDRLLAVCNVGTRGVPYDHVVLILVCGTGLIVSDCNNPELINIKKLPYKNWFWTKNPLMDQPWEPIPKEYF